MTGVARRLTNSTGVHMSKLKMYDGKERLRATQPGERGIGVLEVVFVMAIIAVVSAFGYMSFTKSRDSVRLSNSMRVLAGNVEKARIYAIRRHKSATIEFTSNNAYTVTMDFTGTGNDATTRSYSLDSDIKITNSDGSAIATDDLPVIDFDWRGRTTQCSTSIRMQNLSGKSSTLMVTSSGDITVDSNLGATVNPGTYSNVNQSVDIDSGATITGTTAASSINPCGSTTTTTTGGTTTSSPPAGCTAFSISPSSGISIKRNGGTSINITVTTGSASDTITVTQTDGRSNLSFSPSASQSIGASSSKTFTIKSKSNSTGQFPIKFASACSSTNNIPVTVTVTK